MPSPNDNLPELKPGEFTMGRPRSGELVDVKPGPLSERKAANITKHRINKAAHDVIASRHATLWGRAYGVYEKGGLDDAAEWLTDEVVRVLKELGVAITDDNFTQGAAEGVVIKHGTQVTDADRKASPYGTMTGAQIEDACDEDD